MPILVWVAVLVGLWCAASVAAALALGAFLRRRGEVAAGRYETMRRLDTGPLCMWLSEIPGQHGALEARMSGTVPDTPESLTRSAYVVPAPRTDADVAAPAHTRN